MTAAACLCRRGTVAGEEPAVSGRPIHQTITGELAGSPGALRLRNPGPLTQNGAYTAGLPKIGTLKGAALPLTGIGHVYC